MTNRTRATQKIILRIPAAVANTPPSQGDIASDSCELPSEARAKPQRIVARLLPVAGHTGKAESSILTPRSGLNSFWAESVSCLRRFALNVGHARDLSNRSMQKSDLQASFQSTV